MELSNKIEIIIQILEQCKSDFDWYEARRLDAEREENNVRHDMEGTGSGSGVLPKSKERARLATKWQQTLITRRVAKNQITVNQPLWDYLSSDAGKALVKSLPHILGKTRQAEKAIKNKAYARRPTDTAPMNPVLEKNIDELIREWKRKYK